MFTPPPSPLPLPRDGPADSPTESLLSLDPSSPEHNDDSGFPFPCMPHSSPKSSSTEEKGPRTLLEKKRAGRHILLLVFLLPAALILTASLRHLLRIRGSSMPDLPLIRRSPQAVSSGAPTPTSSETPPLTVPSSPPVLPIPLPQPFDLTLSSNFSTQSCQAFFSDFTQQEEFRQCRAFSFLLNSSSAFLDAQHNETLFNSILWATCNTPRTADDCAATMSGLLSRLNSACRIDMVDGNQDALIAQIGFQSYIAMRTAACLTDPKSNSYCYMDAVTATSPADVYFYALPLGTNVPPNTKPSCSPCIKSVLAVYAQYVDAPAGSGSIPTGSGNSTAGSTVPPSPLPVLSKTYPAAARLAVDRCGGTYASVGVAQQNGASPTTWSPWLLIFVLILLAF